MESTASLVLSIIVEGVVLRSIESGFLMSKSLSVRYWSTLDEALSYGENQFTEVCSINDYFIGIMTSRFAPSSL